MRRGFITVGLTGGIGSGKTAAAEIFERCGAAVIYADRVARKMIDSKGSVRKQIILKFGKESYLPDGKLDRLRMADLIFNNRKLQKELNAIVHPVVISEIDRNIQKIRRGKKFNISVIEAALIFEAGIQDKFDYMVVVDADKDVRMRRMMLRNRESESNIRGRMKSQLSNRIKTLKADFVIKNNGTLKELEAATYFVYRLLIQSLAKPTRK